jgi:hypothetical protein
MSKRILSALASGALLMGGCRSVEPEPSSEAAGPPPRVGNLWVHGGGVVVDLDNPESVKPIVQGTVPTDPNAPRRSCPLVPGQTPD